MIDFFIEGDINSVYPSSQYNFNPDNAYPEYIWGNSEVSKGKNYVYEMVRNCFIGLKLDVDNFNTNEWNPLGEIINQGDTVLIKPNWVMHYNKNKKITKNSIECLITHPSILRVVTDYCLIALKGTGKLIIGDAPMQGCDLDMLLEKTGYAAIFNFYNQHSINLQPTDFRQYSAIFNKNKVIIGKKYNANEAIEVELGKESKLVFDSSKNKRYKVSDYDDEITNTYHNNDNNIYVINKDVLSADVVINLPKPKTHRLSGITGSLKNFVGITYNKASLPHRTVGSKEKGGDEYLHESKVKKLIGKVLDKKIIYENNKKYTKALIMRYIYGLLYYYMRYFSKDNYLIGSWYGNDTIWRTVYDLNYILLYADKNGIIQKDKQRRVFNIADMIISGERNGPVGPDPKILGIIIAGYDGVMMDRLICEIMGFDYTKVPSVLNTLNDLKLTEKNSGDYSFNSNLVEYNEKKIDELQFPKKWRFKPHDSWIGFIEKINK
jgi:uncharacterized protein (DUF362 family)